MVIFNESLAKIAAQYLTKGSKVMVRGALKTRKWTDQAGQERYSTEVVLQGFDAKLILLDSKPTEERAASPSPKGSDHGSAALDDEIPF